MLTVKQFIARNFAALMVGLMVALSVGGCIGNKLAPATEAGLVSAEVALCDALAPVGVTALATVVPPAVAVEPLVPLACSGQSALFKAGLDKVTATVAAVASAAPAVSSATPAVKVATKTATTHPLVYIPAKGYAAFHGSTNVGFLPTRALAVAWHQPAHQAFLDGVQTDLAGK